MQDNSVNRVSGEQFESVKDLLERQDILLDQLNELDQRVEEVIKQFLPPKPDDLSTSDESAEGRDPESLSGEPQNRPSEIEAESTEPIRRAA